jgi:hypothetical protein
MDERKQADLSFFLVLGTVLVVAVIGAIIWLQGVRAGAMPQRGTAQQLDTNAGFWDWTTRGRRVRLTPTPTADPAVATAATATAEAGLTAEVADESGQTTPAELDEVIAVVNKGGCVACHSIPNIPGAVGQVGPDLSHIGVDGATRIEGYTAEAYIRESLLEPGAFTVPECPTGSCVTGVMPTLSQLNEAEIEVLVGYLSTLGVE